ncbi:energy transducer TonB [Flavobacterium terrae]|uniref:Protein involved in gliding motility RemB n=1 Tax=Flavobacterium terrae TaxID=415425 RepID=A0A1M6A8Z4_9FLAO|nr:gliding motility protein RemB [Flavobacterium terrae]SHI32583.1 protein involved in gliding motility RemB [Flavobacterium terrae]
MKKIFLLIFFVGQIAFSQVSNQEKFPVFSACESTFDKDLETCFYNQIQDFVFQNFQVPEVAKQNNFKGRVITLFEVDTAGVFKVLYVDALYPELITETKRVFLAMPKIKPATYNGVPTYAKYTINIAIPLKSTADIDEEKRMEIERKENDPKFLANKVHPEYDQVSINYKEFKNPNFSSNLNIPFSHNYYSQFDQQINQIGTNNHTGSKPYTYNEVAKYYDFNEAYNQIKLNKQSWVGRKLFDENMVAIQGEDYWFTINPVFDLRLGKSNPTKEDYTFVNTRAINIQGGLGSQLNFTTTIYESQGVFADYYNRYAVSIKPSGGNPAIVPGIGPAKEFKETKFDFPSADANITFKPSRFFDFQLGYSRNFIGDGYRSLLEGDGASPYPFFKINTTFWKIKYTNTYMWLKDVRSDVTADRTYATKYMANHYLSWNVSKRLNIGFFESVVWSNQNERGFDVNFVNPIIFYRSVEFASSSRSGNAVLGVTSKYKWNNFINFYGQFLLDEFAVGDMKAGERSWRNKFGYQLGAKYYNAFGVKRLYLQAEYNHVRPYVYAHSNPLTNYGHNNQSMGHIWGSNFREITAIARYNKKRLFGELKVSAGVRGFDIDTPDPNDVEANYGSNIYLSYEDNRPYDKGVTIGQGNKANIVIADFQAGYLLNPSTNMKLFGNFIYRKFTPQVDTQNVFKENTTWFSVGLRSDLFNWYFDY